MNVSDDVGVDGKTPLKGHTSAAVVINDTNDTNDTIYADMSGCMTLFVAGRRR